MSAPVVTNWDALAAKLCNLIAPAHFGPCPNEWVVMVADTLRLSGVVEDGDAYLVRRLRELAEDDAACALVYDWENGHKMAGSLLRELADYLEQQVSVVDETVLE